MNDKSKYNDKQNYPYGTLKSLLEKFENGQFIKANEDLLSSVAEPFDFGAAPAPS